MNVLKSVSIALLVSGSFLVAAGSAQAATIVGTIDTGAMFSPTNQSADGVTYFNAPAVAPFSSVTIGEFDFSIPFGEAVSSVVLNGNFGSNNLGSSTAPVDLFLNNIAVAGCNAMCANNSMTSDVAWSYTFSASELSRLSSGTAILTAMQTNTSQIVLDPTSITIQTAAVPESDVALLIGLGLIPVLAVSRRKSASRA